MRNLLSRSCKQARPGQFCIYLNRVRNSDVIQAKIHEPGFDAEKVVVIVMLIPDCM